MCRGVGWDAHCGQQGSAQLGSAALRGESGKTNRDDSVCVFCSVDYDHF